MLWKLAGSGASTVSVHQFDYTECKTEIPLITRRSKRVVRLQGDGHLVQTDNGRGQGECVLDRLRVADQTGAHRSSVYRHRHSSRREPEMIRINGPDAQPLAPEPGAGDPDFGDPAH